MSMRFYGMVADSQQSIPTPSASPIIGLDWSPADATAFGYLHLNTTAPDKQAFSQTQLTAETAANNTYLAFRSDGLVSNMINVGTNIMAYGMEIYDHTGSTADIAAGGGFCGLGAAWQGGASQFYIAPIVASSANREVRYIPAATYGTGFSQADSQGDLGSFTHKFIIYINGSTGYIGWAYYNHLLSTWVDKGYDPNPMTSWSGFVAPYMFVDNDAVPVPALNGTTISGSFRTDTTWLSDASSVLPVGCKALDGTTI